MFISKMTRYLRNSRNAPQFLSEEARGVFMLGLLALMATPGLAFAVYQFVLSAKNLTIAQAGAELPFKIFVVAMVVSLIIGALLFSMLKRERRVLDLEELLEGVSADELFNPENPVPVFTERIRARLQQDYARIRRAHAYLADFQYRWMSWSDMSAFRKVSFVVVLAIGLATFAYGVVLLAGLVPPRPTPASIDLTRPNGMILRTLRSGQVDMILGLVLMLMGAITALFSTRFFMRMTSKSDEALKRFMEEMNI